MKPPATVMWMKASGVLLEASPKTYILLVEVGGISADNGGFLDYFGSTN
jgi:hypothetical protein